MSEFDLDRLIRAVNNPGNSRDALQTIMANATPEAPTNGFSIEEILLGINNPGTIRNQLQYLLYNASGTAIANYAFNKDRILKSINNNGQYGNALYTLSLLAGGRVSPYVGQVANRCYPYTMNSLNAYKQQMGRKAHMARDNITNPKLVYWNGYVNYTTTFEEKNLADTSTWTASIEYPAGVFTQVTFGGQVSVSPAAGAVFESDACPVSIPVGETFWTRTWRTSDVGSLATEYAPQKNTAIGDGCNFSATTTTDLTMSAGSFAAGGNYSFGPLAIIGTTQKRSILTFGDSICQGRDDTPDALGSSGIFRVFEDRYGVINAGKSSETTVAFLANSVVRRTLARYVTDVIFEHGINDLGALNRTAEQLQDDLTAIGVLVKTAYPSVRLWLSTHTPVTQSSANTITTAYNSIRVAVNDWKRGIPSPFSGVIEMADSLELSRDRGLWANIGDQIDGLHPTQAGYKRPATAGFVNPLMFGP